MKTLVLAASMVVIAGSVMASEGDELTSLSYISYLERYATIQPAAEPDPVEALINMPLIPGDRIDTAREARMEVILADGNIVWIDEYSTLSLDAVAFSRDGQADRTVLYLREGSIMVEVSQHRLTDEPVRIDGPDATAYLTEQGLYRIKTLPSGGLRVEVWEGLAEAATYQGGVQILPRDSAELSGGELYGTESYLTQEDDFAAWVGQRREVIQGESGQYVDARYERQAAQLDNYGNWVYVSEFNTWAWQPNVSSSWQPYSAGRWYWTPAGWSWVSYEPWGWLPYHYGRWYFSVGFGWVWGWGSCWSPAWVNWVWWPGWVGWCPSGFYWGWAWPRYCHYWGYPTWPTHPVVPAPHRGDIPRPRTSTARIVEDTGDRGSVPRPTDSGTKNASGRNALPRPEDTALDLKGRVRVADMDRQGWNVVSDRDFASPHLSRVLKRGDEAFRGRDEVGVVISEPLRTAPPSRVRPAQEIERVLRDAGNSARRDLTPVLARDDSLRPEDALRLVETTSQAALTRRQSPSTDPNRKSSRPTAQGSAIDSSRSFEVADTASPGSRGARRSDPTLTLGAGSPLYGGRVSPRTSGSRGGSPSAGTRQQDSSPPNPFVPRTRPPVSDVASRTRPSSVDPDVSDRSTSSSGRSPSSPTTILRQAPSTRGTTSGGTVQRTPSGSTVPSTRSTTGGSRPVIVPRTSPSTTRRSTTSAPRPSTRNPTSSAGRSRSSSPSRSSVGRAPSGSSGRSSSSAGRSSSGRSSSGRSSAPRSSAGSSRK